MYFPMNMSTAIPVIANGKRHLEDNDSQNRSLQAKKVLIDLTNVQPSVKHTIDIDPKLKALNQNCVNTSEIVNVPHEIQEGLYKY